MEIKTLPSSSIKMLMKMSCIVEKTSISTVDMLKSVAKETEMKRTLLAAGCATQVFVSP